jgi:uncharacterized phage protein (TIGR02220 family)
MRYFKTMINETLADDKLKLLGMEGLGARHLLMCFIAKSPVLNYLYRTTEEPYSDQEISNLLTLGLQQWLQLKERLLRYGGFGLDEQSAVGIPKFAEHQSDYYRQLKYRKGYIKKTEKLHTEVRSKKLEEHIGNTPPTPQGDPAGEVLEYLNQKANRHFDKKNKAHRKFVEARLKDGMPKEMLKRVVDYKTWDWQEKYKDKDRWPNGRPESEKNMEEYIRPETLFNATKCASYVEQVVRWELMIKMKNHKKQQYQGSTRTDLKQKISEEADLETTARIEQLKKKYGKGWFMHYNDA